MKIPTLKTKRLVLRPLSEDDAPWIQEKFNDWDIIQYMNPNVPWPYPEDGAESFLKEVVMPAMKAGNAYHWAICLKNDIEEGIGVISFRTQMDEFDGHRGFWLDKAHHGEGFMTEAIHALNDFVFNTLGWDEYTAENAVQNTASRRVKEKTGAIFIKTVPKKFVCGEMDSEIWKVTKEDWL